MRDIQVKTTGICHFGLNIRKMLNIGKIKCWESVCEETVLSYTASGNIAETWLGTIYQYSL